MSDVKRSDAIWAVSDGHAGNVRQATALADALDAQAGAALALQARAPWRWLAPRGLAGAAHAFGAAFQAQLQHPPRLAIGCGRQAALATRLLRARGSAVVQILDPRIAPRHWDAVVVPEHDRLRGANVVTLLGSLHPVDDAWLARGRSAFARFATLPGPRVALLVGGPTAQVPWTLADLHAVLDALLEQLRGGGSVLATTSRRTPAPMVAALRSRLAAVPGVLWCDARDGDNPYAGLLGWADAVVCSADSANLVSEACATRVPVHVAFAARARGRLRALTCALQQRQRLASCDALLTAGPCTPLRETARVADEVRARLDLD